MADWRSLFLWRSSQQAEVLNLLDRAGARRIGTTAMTELAYEPSGYNAVHGAPKNPWNFDYVTGGSSSGSAVGRCQRLRRLRARLRHRRLAAHSGALLRRHLVEADLRRRAACRRDAPLPEPRHGRHSRAQRLGSAGTRAHSVCDTRGRPYSQSRRGRGRSQSRRGADRERMRQRHRGHRQLRHRAQPHRRRRRDRGPRPARLHGHAGGGRARASRADGVRSARCHVG